MVSAKTNGANEQVGIVRNKDGSIRKTQGRKPTANRDLPTVRLGVMDRVTGFRKAGGIGLKGSEREASRMDTRQVLITEEHMEEDNGNLHKAQADMEMENVILRSQVEAL